MNLTPQSHNSGNLYQSKKSELEFPFMFCLFDNSNGKYDITLTDALSYKSNVPNLEFFFGGNNNKSSSLSIKYSLDNGIYLCNYLITLVPL